MHACKSVVPAETSTQQPTLKLSKAEIDKERTALQSFLYPDAPELGNSEMPIWDHLDELRERLLIAALAAGGAILACFCYSKELVVFLEAPVAEQGVRFLQLSPGEFFFTTFKVLLACCRIDCAGSTAAELLQMYEAKA